MQETLGDTGSDAPSDPLFLAKDLVRILFLDLGDDLRGTWLVLGRPSALRLPENLCELEMLVFVALLLCCCDFGFVVPLVESSRS